MKIFVKCLNCGYVVYTHRYEVFSLLGNDMTCSDCKQPLNFVNVLLCGKDKGGYCDACQFRFQCFSSEPIG